jgi:tetratricopeptide (TPR) repeat protein
VQHAIDRDALLDAVEPLDRLRKLAPNQAQVLELERTLAARRAAESAQWTERGVAQYQAGQIAEAKASWERALALDPGNKVAEENLERAERVLDKLDKLRQLDALDGAQPAVSGGRPGPQNNCC